jgi:mono/diheme cytochrome c family protein
MNTLVTILFAALSFAAAADAPAVTPVIDAKKLYLAKCSTCHAKDGKGSKSMAAMFKAKLEDLDLTSAALQKNDDAAITKIIAGGRNKMPAFKGKLKDAEIAALVGYIRTIAAPAAPAGDTK